MLWAVTSYFNPAAYRARLRNFHVFRRNLRVPLAAVELSCGRPFELQPGDADLLIRIHDGDVLWQKERLLNILIEQLPGDCDYVAWIDCDVLFAREDWAGAAVAELQRSQICQLFGRVLHLPPDGNESQAPEAFPSFGHACAAGMTPKPTHYSPRMANRFRPGHAWCARRELVCRHGLYDRNIVGSADSVIAYASLGRFDEPIAYQSMTPRHAEHCRRWAAAFSKSIHGAVSCVEGDMYHLWHGDLADRRYQERWRILTDFDYDPAADIVCHPHGGWLWNSVKHELHGRIREYFVSRHEDGVASPDRLTAVTPSA